MSFVNAWHGIKEGLGQRNLRVHVFVSFIVVAAGLYFKISFYEWVTVIVLVGLVWAAELFNTSIEDQANIMRDELGAPYSLMGKAKDMAAGAVLVLAIAAAIIGLGIFLPKLISLI